MLKKIICLALCMVMLLSLLVLSVHANPIVLYDENFESFATNGIDGPWTERFLPDSITAGNKRELYKANVLQWTMQKTNNTVVSETGSMIHNNTGTGDKTGFVNKTYIFGGSAVTSTANTYMFHNLLNEYNTGKITVEFAARRPGSNSQAIGVYFYDSHITDTASLPNPIMNFALETTGPSGGSRARYGGAYTGPDTAPVGTWLSADGANSGITSRSWWRIRFIVDLDAQTITVAHSGYETSELTTYLGAGITGREDNHFMAIGTAPNYTMANSFGSIAFGPPTVDGVTSTAGALSLDNVRITYEPSGVVSDLKLVDQNGEQISTTGPIGLSDNTALDATANLYRMDKELLTARLIVAAFDEDDTLLAVRSGADIAVDADNPLKQMTIGSPLNISAIASDIKKIKVFAWDFQSLAPYGYLEQEVVVND